MKIQQNALVPEYFMLDFKHLWVYNEGNWVNNEEQLKCIEKMNANAVNENTLNFALQESESKDIYNVKISDLFFTNKARDRVLEIPYLQVIISLGEPMKIEVLEFVPE